MKCPVCAGVDLKIADREGVEIDYCPQCRGVWLDRGELDKIIERSQTYGLQHSPDQRPQLDRYKREHHDDHHDDHHGYQSHGYPKRKSWLAELFD